MAKEQVKKFIDTIGNDTLENIGFPARSIRKARTDGYFAARWYDPFQRLADELGVVCPRAMFAWADCDVNCVVSANKGGAKVAIVQGAETK